MAWADWSPTSRSRHPEFADSPFENRGHNIRNDRHRWRQSADRRSMDAPRRARLVLQSDWFECRSREGKAELRKVHRVSSILISQMTVMFRCPQNDI